MIITDVGRIIERFIGKSTNITGRPTRRVANDTEAGTEETSLVTGEEDEGGEKEGRQSCLI